VRREVRKPRRDKLRIGVAARLTGLAARRRIVVPREEGGTAKRLPVNNKQVLRRGPCGTGSRSSRISTGSGKRRFKTSPRLSNGFRCGRVYRDTEPESLYLRSGYLMLVP
jgi:hypothetical protein